MIEVKFRGKTEEGVWIYGDLIHNNEQILIHQFDVENIEDVNTHEVLKETVGQLAKRTKNQEIYVGDLFKTHGIIYEIVFRVDSNGARFMKKSGESFSDLGDEIDNYVYIGTIHDKGANIEH